jgi:hypothetical protein
LRQDLPQLKGKDTQLAGTLGYIDTKPISPEQKSRAVTPPLEQRLVSGDMQREALRAKWEQEEAELRDKDDLHYQDVLFDGEYLAFGLIFLFIIGRVATFSLRKKRRLYIGNIGDRWVYKTLLNARTEKIKMVSLGEN